jgi:hypothetical protein
VLFESPTGSTWLSGVFARWASYHSSETIERNFFGGEPMATYSIFGCGPAGLYTAWRLVTSGKLSGDDTICLYDWGKYRFSKEDSGTRAPSGRICTYHYKNKPGNTYVEMGGMRYIEWDGTVNGTGHRLVTTVIEKLGLKEASELFNTTNDPLFYLRQRNFYQSQISSFSPAPYNADHCFAAYPPDNVLNYVAAQALGTQQPETRSEQCRFYSDGVLPDTFNSTTYKPGDPIKNIGYWNLIFDQVGSEAYLYTAAGNGYESNVINWNAADALIYNNEFVPGGTFKTLKTGYSTIFAALFEQIKTACAQYGINLEYHPHTRLRSIYLNPERDNQITFTLAKARAPFKNSGTHTTDHAFLCMPTGSLQIVADASLYHEGNIIDVLNYEKVVLYRESVIKQPSYKVAMFFDTDWWTTSMYPPKLAGENVFGPTITDTPLRQVYYFGNNSLNQSKPVYALLASYDDEQFTGFWEQLELSVSEVRRTPLSWGFQPLKGPQQATPEMVNMLRAQLAGVHNGPGADISTVPQPLETVFMDWSQKPFCAGYHAWAAHYDIDDVMQNIRKPTQLIDGADASLYIVGSAYSNDQAWVEGAFCTSESVLKDFFGLKPIISEKGYPFICRGRR